jgi:hypothetical protein
VLAPTFQLIEGGNPRLTLRQVSFRNGDILPHAIHSVVITSLLSLCGYLHTCPQKLRE